MRKLTIALLLATLTLLMGATVALADGGPHGKYQQTVDGMNSEDKCAGCHRAHTAKGASLITHTTVYDLCVTCHGGAGGGSSNVLTGTSSYGGNLNGGMFQLTADGGAATSIHTVTDGITEMPDASSNTLARGLTCTSCHDPHGMYWSSTGERLYAYATLPTGSVEQYRMLRAGPNKASTWSGQVLSNESPKSKTTPNWKSGTAEFCLSCHDLDDVRIGADGTHRHAANDPLPASYDGRAMNPALPVQTSGTGTKQLVCMTCHKPHGTSTVNVLSPGHGGSPAYARSNSVTGIPGVVVDDPTNPTYLLRMNNRGVCQDCHQK